MREGDTNGRALTDLEFASIDLLDDVVRVLLLDLACATVGQIDVGQTSKARELTANRLGRAEDLLDSAAEFLGERLVSHGAGNVDHIVNRDVAGVHAALFLFAVSGWLFEGLDHQR